jgi:hypothetical protein
MGGDGILSPTTDANSLEVKSDNRLQKNDKNDIGPPLSSSSILLPYC